MNFSTPKYLILIVILSSILLFNFLFFTDIKKRTDVIYNNYILTHIDEKAKAEISLIMQKKLYTKNDLDYMANIAFKAYKESLKKRDLLASQVKNISLINIKMVIYDNNNYYFGLNYFFNLTAIICFIFIFIFKEQSYEVRYEPTLHS